jgi:hypothetical protein
MISEQIKTLKKEGIYMACRDFYNGTTCNNDANKQVSEKEAETPLLFGVDSKTPANTILQNNLTEFEWATKTKLYPNFWGRNISGENSLTKDEIAFLHSKGCKIAAIYYDDNPKDTENNGAIAGKNIAAKAIELGIPKNVAIFLAIGADEKANAEYMKGYANCLVEEGFTPGFRANTDAHYSFDAEFSRGMQADKTLFDKCLIWAVAPTLKDYNGITTSHLIHPDNWGPFAPSSITKSDIAIWQYGNGCHPILDYKDNKTSFNVNLVKSKLFITEKLF